MRDGKWNEATMATRFIFEGQVRFFVSQYPGFTKKNGTIVEPLDVRII